MRDQPVKIRFFTDDASGIALWPDSFWDFPGSKVEYLFVSEGQVEDLLPISTALRDGIRAWVDEYTASINERVRFDPHEHDRRGHRLSQKLQGELGDGFKIEYGPRAGDPRREADSPAFVSPAASSSVPSAAPRARPEGESPAPPGSGC